MDLSSLPLYRLEETNKVGERVYKTGVPGLFFISTQVFEDNRGFYREVSIIPDLEESIESSFNIQQVNHSHSNANVIRGFHAEDWNKLVTVVNGVCLCVIADVRPDSDTFLKSEYILLGYGEGALPGSLFVSRGLANSQCTIQAPMDYVYAVDALYKKRDKSRDTAISLFDPDLNVKWPIPKEQMIVSDRDRNSVMLKDKYPEKLKSS